MTREEMVNEINHICDFINSDVHKKIMKDTATYRVDVLFDADELHLETFKDDYIETSELFDYIDASNPFLSIAITVNYSTINLKAEVWVDCHEDDTEDFTFTYSIKLDGSAFGDLHCNLNAQTDSYRNISSIIKDAVPQPQDNSIQSEFVALLQSVLDAYFEI